MVWVKAAPLYNHKHVDRWPFWKEVLHANLSHVLLLLLLFVSGLFVKKDVLTVDTWAPSSIFSSLDCFLWNAFRKWKCAPCHSEEDLSVSRHLRFSLPLKVTWPYLITFFASFTHFSCTKTTTEWGGWCCGRGFLLLLHNPAWQCPKNEFRQPECST